MLRKVVFLLLLLTFVKGKVPQSCIDHNKPGSKDGLYEIYVHAIGANIPVYCDMTTDGGGWMVFQRRLDGSEEFYRPWTDYENGFGKRSAEFWLGLKKLASMFHVNQTGGKSITLRVDLEELLGNVAYATYDNFRVGNGSTNYKIESLGNYTGDAGDSLRDHEGQPFTTYDRDNDANWFLNCAQHYSGGWWYNRCFDSLLNGYYFDNDTYVGIVWIGWSSEDYDKEIKKTEMKIRETDFEGNVPQSCKDHIPSSSGDGEYEIYVHAIGANIPVYCDMTTDGGGWMVFQRRLDGSEEFYRPWTDYENGFGNNSAEFWFGLEKLASMFHAHQTGGKSITLRVDFEDFQGNVSYAVYDNFRVGNASTNYKLESLGNYTGDAGDSLHYQEGLPFSTYDRDSDVHKTVNCAQRYHGAWWYKSCFYSNLNGNYNATRYGVVWYHWLGFSGRIKKTEMKIR